MKLSAKLELRQSQQLVMTPQLQLAIRLLQLSNVDLAQFVEAEIERNPLLERDEAGEGGHETDPPAELPSPPPQSEPAGDDAWLDLFRPLEDKTGTLDIEYENVFPDAIPSNEGAGLAGPVWTSAQQRLKPYNDETIDLEAIVPLRLSLKDHLAEQLVLALRAPADRLIGRCLIDLVDDAGYLTADVETVAELLGAPVAAVETGLAVLQTFDPPGVFARSLTECLALQLKDRDRHDPWMASLLSHLDLVATHDLDALKKAVGAPMGEIIDMIGELKRLDPKPGLRYGAEEIRTVIPDVLVRPAAGDGWIVELNTETLPRVLVNRAYCARVSQVSRAGDRGYLQECLQTANWLARTLDQRARTILRVAEEIVRQQHAFLAEGVQHLRPLNLKTVAGAISMHESTVSRVTSNKYMATPGGIFELKYFFTSAINATGAGEAFSSEAVRERIRRLIEDEAPRSVLSDDKIVLLLKSSGVDIARRTVAKYREAMRIPSSVQRRRAKRLNGRCGVPV